MIRRRSAFDVELHVLLTNNSAGGEYMPWP
jgi:hypothetical protein